MDPRQKHSGVTKSYRKLIKQCSSDGKSRGAILLEKLNKTIELSNEITSEQNQSLIKYTRRILLLTVVMTFVAISQLIFLFK